MFFGIYWRRGSAVQRQLKLSIPPLEILWLWLSASYLNAGVSKKETRGCMRIIWVNRNRAEKSSMCHTMFFVYLILFSSFLLLFLFIYLQVSSFIYFYFSYVFIFLQNGTKFCRPWTSLPLFAFSLEHAFRLADLWPPVLADANTV
jgi:hypothetical protein